MTLPPLSPDGTLVLPLRHAGQLARVAGPAVTMANAFDWSIEVLSVIGPDDDSEGHLDRLVQVALDLSGATERPCVVRVLVSEESLATVTTSCSGRLVCMGTSASPYDERHYVGSFAAALLAESTAPVLLVGPACDPTARSQGVTAAVSGQIESTSVLPYAAALARTLDLPLSTIHVRGPATDAEAAMRLWFPGELHTSLEVETLAGSDVASTLAERADHSIVAVATHARQGLAWIAEGSIAFDVVAAAALPVLAVGPRIGPIADGPGEAETIRELVEIVDAGAVRSS